MFGVLPEVAKTFGVSVPTAGLLVTSYALGLMIGAPVMTLLGTKVSRKHMLTLRRRRAHGAFRCPGAKEPASRDSRTARGGGSAGRDGQV